MFFNFWILNQIHGFPDGGVLKSHSKLLCYPVSLNVCLWCRWYRGWEEYVQLKGGSEVSTSTVHSNGGPSHSPRRPGRIDNSELVSHRVDGDGNAPELRRNLQEGEDYSLVPYAVWKKLHEWYLP